MGGHRHRSALRQPSRHAEQLKSDFLRLVNVPNLKGAEQACPNIAK
jgi:hypothetical protein